jgi:DNA polymerase elongation subunit (family B)
MAWPVLVFDIETIPDMAGWRRLHGGDPEASDAQLHAQWKADRAAQGQSDFMPLYLQRVLCISCVFRNAEGLRVHSFVDRDGDGEARVVQTFFNAIEKHSPQLVSWNGSGFDWPYLLHRAAVHGINLGITVTGKREGKYRTGVMVTGNTWRHADVWVAWGPMMTGLWLPSGLKPVARLFGLDPIEVDRTRMADLTDDERQAYALSDVRCTLGLANIAGPLTVTLITD